MKQYLWCIFTYFMVSWNSTFGDTTTWKPVFDVSPGKTQTWTTTVWPTMAWVSTANPIREIPIRKPTAPPCKIFRPLSCLRQKLEYLDKLKNGMINGQK